MTPEQIQLVLADNVKLRKQLDLALKELGKLADELDSIRRLMDDLRSSIAKN